MKHEFGLREGKILHISEITKRERGKACNCICPYCKEPLVAKKGKQNVHHFAHLVLECEPHKAYESVIHLIAKDILVEKKYIRVPSLYFLYLMSYRINEIQEGVFDIERETREECIIELQHVGKPEVDEMTIKVIDEQTVSFEEIVTEVKINDFIPDVLIKSNMGMPLAIEIAVTHFIDDEKKEENRKS